MGELAVQVKDLKINSNPVRRDSALSLEQLEIVHANQPVAIVIAGPGAGKTRTLVERISYLIKESGVNPAEITGVTFTNKAALEMKSRLAAILNGDKRVNRVNLGTFHSLAWRILNESPDPLASKLLDEFEARDIIEEVLRQKRIPMTAREAALIISLVKNKYLWEEELAIPPKVVEIYQAYQQSLQLYQRYDFDDVLIKTFELWEAGPDWLTPIKQQFNYLLVDEFQDINLLQYKLIKLWAQNSKSLMAIGDPNQSIYGFRGAGAQFFKQVGTDFPAAVSLHLSRNYRASAPVIKAANALIPAEYRQTVLISDHKNAPNIVQFEVFNEKVAARTLADEVIGLLGGSTMLSAHGQRIPKRSSKMGDGSYSFSDMAILYRTGRQAAAIEQALAVAGLPYRVVGPTGTLEGSTVKEFLTFFRYLNAPDDLFLLRANLRQPRWGFRNGEVAELIDLLRNSAMASGDKLDSLLDADIAAGSLVKLRQFYGVVQYYKAQTGRKNQEIIDDWLLRMDPVETEDLERLKKICENYRSLEELTRFLPLATEADIFRKGNKTAGTEAITLSTIHAAKGLEFPVVFIIGVEEGLLPYGTEPDPDTVAEEQRLFYVALTRTSQQLYLVNSQFRNRYGEPVAVDVSRFLKLISSQLIEKVIPEQYEKQAKQLELF